MLHLNYFSILIVTQRQKNTDLHSRTESVVFVFGFTSSSPRKIQFVRSSRNELPEGKKLAVRRGHKFKFKISSGASTRKKLKRKCTKETFYFRSNEKGSFSLLIKTPIRKMFISFLKNDVRNQRNICVTLMNASVRCWMRIANRVIIEIQL